MEKIIKDYFNIDEYLSMQQIIQEDFKISPSNDKKILIKKKLKEMIKNSKGIYDPKGFINDFSCYIKKIDELGKKKNELGKKKIELCKKQIVLGKKQIQFGNKKNEFCNNKIELGNNKNELGNEGKIKNETIENIKNNYKLIKNYIENSSSIRFLLVGPHNAGKSTLLNEIIGYNRRLLESANKECTKISVIVKYTKKTEMPKLFAADFHTNNFGYNYFEKNDLLAVGENDIIEKIKDLNRENELKFYILSTPIEIFDRIIEENKINDVKIEEIIEKIELLDFPGLDTNYEEAKKKAEDLLKIVDGFIYVNYSINFESANKDILGLIYNSIKDRNNFSFDNCLFILNKIDEEENKGLNLDEATQKILKIFDEQNDFADSITVLDRKNRIQDKALSLSPFSCYRYKEFKQFESDITNFEDFIKSNLRFNSKKKIVKILIKTLEGYIDNINLSEINLPIEELNNYMEKLNILLNEVDDKSEKNLVKIIKLYFYIKNNIRRVKVYKLCFIEPLLKNFKRVIKKTSVFFEDKLRNDALSFIMKSYEELLDFFYIIKLRMSDENIDKFKQLNKDEILSKIEEEYDQTMDDIKNLFKTRKDKIFDEIDNCRTESKFTEIVSNHKGILEYLKIDVNHASRKFQQFLKRLNDDIIRKLNLQELKERKKDFENQMNKIKALTISESVDSNTSKYIQSYYHTSYHTETYKERVFLFFYKTKTRTVSETTRVYEHEKTVKNYKKEISAFFINAENSSTENIKKNKKEIKNNIENIFRKFNESVEGFQNNIDELKEYIDEIERFIYNQTGIKG